MARTILSALLTIASLTTPMPAWSKQPAPGGESSIRPVWGYAIFDGEVGRGGITVYESADEYEIYACVEQRYWMAVRPVAGTGEYELLGFSEDFDGALRNVEIGDVLGDEGFEILTGVADGRVRIDDRVTKRRVAEFDTGLDDLEKIRLFDFEGDGITEILAVSATRTVVLRGDGTIVAEFPVGGTDIVVGEMDGDPSHEIAVTDGSVIDFDARSVQWSWFEGFGDSLHVVDSDGDLLDELIVVHDSVIFAFDIDRELPVWSLDPIGTVRAVTIGDTDADGELELIVGEGTSRDVRGFSLASRELLWEIRIDSRAGEVHGLALIDTDGDGFPEVAGGFDRFFFVGNPRTAEIEWRNTDLNGPLIGPVRGDIDDDGRPEIVASTTRSGLFGGTIHVFDGADRRLRATSTAIGEVRDVELRDVDGDGRDEILIASESRSDGVIEIYEPDPKSDALDLLWTNADRPEDSTFYAVDAADVDQDGEIEVIAISARDGTGPGNYVHVYDYETATEEARTPNLGFPQSEGRGMTIADTDGDGRLEILALLTGADGVHVFDGETLTEEGRIRGRFVTLRVDTPPSSGKAWILVSEVDGNVLSFRHRGGTYVPGPMRNVDPDGLTGFSVDLRRRMLFAGSGSTLGVYRPPGDPDPAAETRPLRGIGERTVLIPDERTFVTAGSYAVIEYGEE